MMARRILSIMRRDVRHSLREFILMWAILAPFVLALIMRTFLPSVGGAGLMLVVSEDLGPELMAELDRYAHVEVVRDREAVERRVLALDDVAGIVAGAQGPVIILEGNEGEETAELPRLILADIMEPRTVEFSERDLGRGVPPILPLSAIFLALMALMIGGMVIGFNIIEEKETNTIQALGVSPISRREYLAGRAVLASIVSLALVFVVLYVIGLRGFDPWKVLAVAATGLPITVIFGLYIGSIASNQVEGIGAMKIGSLAFLIIPILAIVFPARLLFTLYWMPTYWTYEGLRVILMESAGWAQVWRLAGINLVVNVGFMAALYGVLTRRISIRG